MSKSPLVPVVLAVLLLGSVVPTGATGGDQLWSDPAVVLSPGNGSGGAYASLDGDGELEIDVTAPGVNAGAVTTFAGVFSVENRDSEAVAVWFSHDAPADVVLSVDGRSAQREDDPLVLAAGERASVDLAVDSGSYTGGDLVLSSFTIHADEVSTSTATTGSSTTGSSTTSTGSSTTSTGGAATPTPVATPTAAPAPATDETSTATPVPAPAPPAPADGDQVVFADGVEPGATFVTLDPATAARIDAGARSRGPPRAVIDAALAPRTLGASADVSSNGTETVVSVGETVTVSGHRTVFGSAEAIQPDGRIARLVEVTVPPDRADESALVRLAVPRERLGGADPTAARIGRHTGAGWQLLETTVVHADADRVVLQARTPGFSPFAVFPDPDVTYDWQFPDATAAGSGSVETRLDEPGRHVVTLTVTDGLGRSATARYHLVANDRPRLTIEAPATIEPDRPVTLRAAVTDRVGETTVTWRFDDGTTVVGRSVERSFPAGEHVVGVTVTDEYGATTTDTVTLAVGDTARAGRTARELVRLQSGVEGRLVIGVVVGLLLLTAFRRASARPRRPRRRRSR